MTAGAELSRASAMIDLGRFAEAVRLLGAVVAAAPDSCRAWCLLSRAQLGHGDPAAAVVAARRASALIPADEHGAGGSRPACRCACGRSPGPPASPAPLAAAGVPGTGSGRRGRA